MAIFSAGCIAVESRKKLRKKIYNTAKNDLDSPAMQMALKAGRNYVNYIAFLPKEKLQRQNVLDCVAKSSGRAVVVFELDFKHVGVVCEEGKIVDYLLDKPETFARERDYNVILADNLSGPKLTHVNLKQQQLAGFITKTMSLFFIAAMSVVLYGGYIQMEKMREYKEVKAQVKQEYKSLLQSKFERAKHKIRRVDTLRWLGQVEDVCKKSGSNLKQFVYNEKSFCAQIKAKNKEEVLAYLPSNTRLIENNSKELVQYCYEKI